MRMRAILLVMLVMACSKKREPERDVPKQPEVVRGRPGNETDEQIRAEVEALEAKAQRGELEWVRTQGHDLYTLGKDGKPTKQPFPVPKFDSGDSINGAWLAPDGTLFTAGYMITGKPGPDTGAIHRLAPGGKLERVFEMPERELWNVWGKTATDVYAIGPKLIVHFDGKAWTEVPTTGVDGTINQITGTASDVFVVAVKNDPEESRIYKLSGTTLKLDHEVPCLLRGLSFAGTTGYASGACNTVFRRGPDGKWTTERIPEGGAFGVVAVSPAVAYVAAEQLLRREPSGKWVVAKVPLPRVHGIHRARGEQVFVVGNKVAAGGDSAVLVGSGDSYEPLPLENCGEIVANADVIYCIRERMVASEPPEDLR